MIVYDNVEQGTPEWYQLRHGKITMSHAKALLTGGKGKTRQSYLMSVAAEIVSDFTEDSYQSNDMIRGNELESFALECVKDYLGYQDICRVGFVEHDCGMIGCSPDALTNKGGIEIKSPRPQNHLKYLDRLYVEKEHGPQIQGGMWVCERETWLFVSFCPWVKKLPVITHLFTRDDEIIKKLSDSALSGIDEIMEIVADVSGNNPSKRIQEISDEAIKHIEEITTINDEVIL